MRIKTEVEKKYVHFKTLKGGDIIKYQDRYYILMQDIVTDISISQEYNVMDLEDGEVYYIYDHESVELITKYEFIIKQ